MKGSQALDALARVDTVVFDKTGTLTRGILEVTDVIPTGDVTPEALLALAAGAEEHYAHPVARAGEKFHVDVILGGTKARRMLRTRGIEPGKVLILEGVAQAQSLQVGVRNPVVISSREGLRLFLTPSEGKQILVRGAGTDD
ncbi:MAG: HAD family hydrolase [Desulfosarcina sp.]|nr:HAD family hydrolase [Desulfosarcina sp.]